MMDHYEELGLDRSASPDEIRLAYRRLVRLLHPDRCADERIRHLAELQMKRLNDVMALLTHPARRMHYDRALALNPSELALSRPPVWNQSLRHRWFWPVAAGVALLALAAWLLLVSYAPPARPQAASIPMAPASKAPVRQVRPQKPRARAVIAAPRHEEFALVTAMVADLEHPPERSLEEAAAPAGESPPPPVETAIQRVPPIEAAPVFRPTLSGEWLFVPSHAKSSGLYPPEYIELRVSEESGILRGRYRARYHIADRAISPTVMFQFEGRAGTDGASLPWKGIGGSRGEVTLRLLGGSTLQVEWVATQMGNELGLISGTATLVRRLD